MKIIFIGKIFKKLKFFEIEGKYVSEELKKKLWNILYNIKF